jgi:hypothetical protein
VIYLVGVIVSVAVLAGVVVLAVYMGDRLVASQPPSGSETILQTMQDADRGHVHLEFGLGALQVRALTGSPNFVEGNVDYSRYSLPVVKGFRVREGEARFSLQARSRPIPLWFPGDAGEDWDLQFNTRIPLHVQVEMGAGNVHLDLRELRVTSLDVGGGAGRAFVRLPSAAAFTEASISAGVGEITVEIPENVGAKVRVSRALTAVRLENPRLARSGDEYVTDNYAAAENKLDLRIESAVGAITIR